MEQCLKNLEQFRTTLRTSRTTWNNRQKFNFCERRFRQAKKAFFSSYNNGIQLIIWNNVQNNQNKLEQPAKVRFSKIGGLAQKFFFISLLWVLFQKFNIMEQCRTNLEQIRTTLRTGRTTWNNRQKFNFCERRVRQAKKAFFSSYNNGIQLIISNNVQNNQKILEQPAKVRFSKSGGLAQKFFFISLLWVLF